MTAAPPAPPAAPDGPAELGGVQAWLRRAGEPVHLELACAEHPDPAAGPAGRTVVRLTACAATVAVHELVELLAAGAAVTLRLDGCGAPAEVRAHLAGATTVLAAAGVAGLRLEDTPPAAPEGLRLPGRRRRRPVLDAAHMPVSRRRLLGLGAAAAPDVGGLTAHERLVAALHALGVGQPGGSDGGPPGAAAPDLTAGPPAGSSGTAAPSLAALPGPAPRLRARGCTACGVCVRACPTGALGVRDGGGLTTLLQDPAACDGCRRCLDLCPESALSVDGAWPWDRVLAGDPAPVATLTTTTCARCGTLFPTSSGERLCPVCTFRRRSPFGSALPRVGADRVG
ncbi:4Fe-4S dicluster domain-containing protein [Georgenia ruanii]|uniref:4Fe-4S dicluster domain-containing protein n=1 Tax=Georgenia ruanii TaxID=348442 RepID=UPI00126468A0|nr:4Fe-4S dicluster domain-containing protein [Georgenia ruanii]